jgi:hypothetical protein
MKKLVTLLLFFVGTFVSAFLFNSCSKDSEVDLSKNEIVPSYLLDKAKNWFGTQTNSLSAFNIAKGKSLSPIWEESRLKKLADGRMAIIAPAEEFILENKEIGFERGYVFPINGDEVTNGVLAEFYADADYITKNRKILFDKVLDRKMEGFTGAVITYDVNYRYLNGVEFKNGEKTNATTIVKPKIPDNQDFARATGCIYTYLVITYTDGTQIWNFLYATCSDPFFNGENPGNTNYGSNNNNVSPLFLVGGSDPNAIPIANVSDHLKCFKPWVSGAKLTIYVDQPVRNSNQAYDPNDPFNVGHTFLSIEQGETSRTIGFYPKGSAYPSKTSDPSQLKDNAGKGWDVSVSIDISRDELQTLLNYIKTNTPTTYDLNTFNCTNWVIEACAKLHIHLPTTSSTWPLGGNGLNLGQFGEDMRTFKMPGRTLTTSVFGQSGNASPNKGVCP